MPAMIVAGVGALAGGLMGSSASRRAAQTQAQAQLEAARLQAAAAERAIQMQGGAIQGGLDVTQGQRRGADIGLAALMSGLGLGQFRVGPQTSGGGYTGRDGRAYTGPVFTNAQGQAVDAQGNVLSELPTYNLGGATQAEADAAASPYAGTFLERFTGQDIYMDPSYQFRLDEGRRNLEASLAARGNRLGSQSLKDITNYGQQAASQEYQSAFQRFEAQKQRQFNQLMGMIAPGVQAQQGAAGNIQQGGMNQGQAAIGGGQALGTGVANAGQATAGGIVGSTNALVSGLGQLGQLGMTNQMYNQQMQMFNRMYGGGNMPFGSGVSFGQLSGMPNYMTGYTGP